MDGARRAGAVGEVAYSVASACQSSLQLALVHLGAPFDVEALCVAIKLLLGLLTCWHELSPFGSLTVGFPEGARVNIGASQHLYLCEHAFVTARPNAGRIETAVEGRA